MKQVKGSWEWADERPGQLPPPPCDGAIGAAAQPGRRLASMAMGEISGRVNGGEAAAGIVVSDGYSVTTTDDLGRFALSIVGPFVFVTRPTWLASWTQPTPISSWPPEISPTMELNRSTPPLPVSWPGRGRGSIWSRGITTP